MNASARPAFSITRIPETSHAVLVVTGDTVLGLAATRSLGRRGVRTYTAYRSSSTLGRYSRYCDGSLRLPSGREAALQAIEEFVRARRVTHIMAAGEADVNLLNSGRSRLEARAGLLFPPKEIYDRALYKDRTIAIARQCGVPVPGTAYPSRADDLEECAALGFPLILKPRHRDTTYGWRPIFYLKLARVETIQELERRLENFAACGELPMVQRYVPGYGIGVSILMRSHAVQLIFQHRRLREWPPDGGVSVFCESVPLDPRLAAQSVALLRAMDWEGAAMVEYRFDPITQSAVLMEVNGRFWGSIPLAVSAGVDFPYALYRSTMVPMRPSPYRIGVRARDLVGDTRWLVSVLRTGSRPRMGALRDYLNAFRPGVQSFSWSVRDPLPSIMNRLTCGLRIIPDFIARRAARRRIPIG